MTPPSPASPIPYPPSRAGRLAAAIAALLAASGPAPLDAVMTQESGIRWGLVVAASRYADSRIATRGDEAAAAPRIEELLRIRFGYSARRVTLLRDNRATAAAIYRALDGLGAQVGERDSLLVYVSLHTARSIRDGDMLVPYDGEPAQPWTLIPVRTLIEALGKSRAASLLVVFDGCVIADAAPPTTGQQPYMKTKSEPGRPVEVLSGCSAGREGWERGGFAALLYGILGRAAEEQRALSVADLAAELRRGMVSVTAGTLGEPGYSRTGEWLVSTTVRATAPFRFVPLSRDPVTAAREGGAADRKKAIGELGQVLLSEPGTDRSLRALRVLVGVVDSGEDAEIRTVAVSALAFAKDDNAVRALATVLSAPGADAELRLAAVAALERIGLPSVVGPLQVAAEAGPPRARAAALRALGRLSSTASLPVVLRALEDADAGDVTFAALEAIERLAIVSPVDRDAASRALVRLLDRPTSDPSIRRSVIGLLGSLGDPASALALISHLETDSDPGVRRAAAAALGRLSGDTRERDEAVRALLRALRGPDPVLREAAATTLGQMKAAEAASSLLTALADEDSRVRSAAVGALAGLDLLQAPAPFVAALADDSADVRRAAALALGARCSPEAGQPLLERSLSDPEPAVRDAAKASLKTCGAGESALASVPDWAVNSDDPRVRASALSRLAATDPGKAIPALVAALDDADLSVRQQAIALAAKLPEALPALARVSASGTVGQRLGAVSALGSSGNPAAVELLASRATADEDRAVRLGAIRALGNFTHPRAVEGTIAAARSDDKDLVLAAIDALTTQSGIYYRDAEYRQGLDLARLVLQLRERILGPDHPDLALDLNNMAVFYQRLNDYNTAQVLNERALSIRMRYLGEDHPAVAVSQSNLASVYLAQGQLDRAESLFLLALRTREKALGPSDPDLVQSLQNLADLYARKGQPGEAEMYRNRAMRLRAQPAKAEPED